MKMTQAAVRVMGASAKLYLSCFIICIEEGSCSLRCRQWKISRQSWFVKWKTDKLFEQQRTLFTRNTRKQNKKSTEKSNRRDNDNAGQRDRPHLSDRLIVDRILDCCKCDGGRFFICLTHFRFGNRDFLTL